MILNMYLIIHKNVCHLIAITAKRKVAVTTCVIDAAILLVIIGSYLF